MKLGHSSLSDKRLAIALKTSSVVDQQLSGLNVNSAASILVLHGFMEKEGEVSGKEKERKGRGEKKRRKEKEMGEEFQDS